jgi:hypothetical protein
MQTFPKLPVANARFWPTFASERPAANGCHVIYSGSRWPGDRSTAHCGQ